MAPPKKTVKMDLNSFLNDDTFGSSWADEEVDLNKINIPIENANANTIPLEDIAAAKNGGNNFNQFGSGSRMHRLDPALEGNKDSFGGRREREEYPVPDFPPYRAIINNIPWDITPEGVKAWVEDGLNKPDSVEDIDLPKNISDPTRLKGMAFVSLKERDDLVKALTFNATKLNERTVYVSVAAPRRGGFGAGGDDFDWSGARGSQFQASGRREEANLDWDSARGSNYRESRPRREEPNLDWDGARGSNFRESRPRREEPNLDWDGARGSNFRESRPKREEPNLDWDAVRGSNFRESRPKREEANLDWSAARGSNFENKPQKTFGNRGPRKEEPSLDWGAARGSNFGKPKSNGTSGRKILAESKVTEEKVKIQKSAFDVLRGDDDDEEDEDKSAEKKTVEEPVEQLASKTAKLSVEEDNDDSWEVVGKK